MYRYCITNQILHLSSSVPRPRHLHVRLAAPSTASITLCYCNAMSKALGRLLRFIRSILFPATAIIGFSCLLTFFFVLYQPTRGPGDIQRLGWQSWDIVSPSATADLPSGGNTPPPTSGDHNADVDWWNVTASDTTNPVDSSSLPLDVWAPLLPQDTGCDYFICVFPLSELSVIPTVSEIAVVRCIFELGMIDVCAPSSSTSDDAIKGKWVRVPRDLNLQSGMWHLVRYPALPPVST